MVESEGHFFYRDEFHLSSKYSYRDVFHFKVQVTHLNPDYGEMPPVSCDMSTVIVKYQGIVRASW